MLSCAFGALHVDMQDADGALGKLDTPRLTASLVVTQRQHICVGGASSHASDPALAAPSAPPSPSAQPQQEQEVWACVDVYADFPAVSPPRSKGASPPRKPPALPLRPALIGSTRLAVPEAGGDAESAAWCALSNPGTGKHLGRIRCVCRREAAAPAARSGESERALLSQFDSRLHAGKRAAAAAPSAAAAAEAEEDLADTEIENATELDDAEEGASEEPADDDDEYGAYGAEAAEREGVLLLHVSNDDAVRLRGVPSMLGTWSQVALLLAANGRAAARTFAVVEYRLKQQQQQQQQHADPAKGPPADDDARGGWEVLGQLGTIKDKVPTLHALPSGEGWELHVRLFEKPTNPWMAMVQFCTAHAPQAMLQVEPALCHWEGREQELMACFHATYASSTWRVPRLPKGGQQQPQLWLATATATARKKKLNSAELEKLKRALLAASYTQHGVDLDALFARLDRDRSGALDASEIGPVIEKMLPGVLTKRQLKKLVETMDADGDGQVTLVEFTDFVHSRRKPESKRRARAAPSSPLSPATASSGAAKLSSPRRLKREADAQERVAQETEKLKRTLLSAAYTQHGVDLAALFVRLDKDQSGSLELSEIGPVISKMLPGVLSQMQISMLMADMDADGDGRVTLTEFVEFVNSRRKPASKRNDQNDVSGANLAPGGQQPVTRRKRRSSKGGTVRLYEEAKSIAAQRDKLVNDHHEQLRKQAVPTVSPLASERGRASDWRNDAGLAPSASRPHLVNASQRRKASVMHMSASSAAHNPGGIGAQREKILAGLLASKHGAAVAAAVTEEAQGGVHDQGAIKVSQYTLRGRAAEVYSKAQKKVENEAAQLTFQPEVGCAQLESAGGLAGGGGGDEDVFTRLHETQKLTKAKIQLLQQERDREVDERLSQKFVNDSATAALLGKAGMAGGMLAKDPWERLQEPTKTWRIRRDSSEQMGVARRERAVEEAAQLTENKANLPEREEATNLAPRPLAWDADAHYERREMLEKEHGLGLGLSVRPDVMTEVRSSAHHSPMRPGGVVSRKGGSPLSEDVVGELERASALKSARYQLRGRAAEVAMRMAAGTAGSPRQSRHPPPFGVAGGEQPGEEDRSAGGMFGRHAHTGSEELEQLKRKLVAAAYTSHGVDLGALFESYDLDHDGALQLAELGPHLQKMLPGVLSKQQEDKLLAAMDADGDNQVTLAELVAFVDSRRGAHTSSRPRRIRTVAHFTASHEELEQLKRKLIAAAYTSHGVDLGALFESYDLDHDGALQLAELGPHLQKMLPGVLSKPHMDKLLAAMDVDSDGSVTLAELRTFVETRDIGHGNAEDASIAVEEFDEDETF
jgi:Ca2+-binding EF-hand superfamily protein